MGFDNGHVLAWEHASHIWRSAGFAKQHRYSFCHPSLLS